MRKLADISFFESLQSCFNKFSPMSVFNAPDSVSIDEIKDLVLDWMDQIEAFNELNAREEADAESAKMESFLTTMRERIQIAVRAARNTVAELKQSGAMDESESESSEESEPSDMGGDVLSEEGMGEMDLGGGEDMELSAPEEEEE